MKSRVMVLVVVGMALLSFSGCAGVSTTAPGTGYTIGGVVSGLPNPGLEFRGPVLQNNGGEALPITGNGSFRFATPMASGGTYKVTVLTQPTIPAVNCAVTNGSGTATANVTSVQVICKGTGVTYTIGGTVSGLSGKGLVLQDNSGDNLPVSANGSFTFATPIGSGNAYSVTVLTEPSSPAQTCTVTNGGGTAKANVTNVQVTCTTNSSTGTTYTIGGTVSGLSGTGLVLQDNGSDNLPVSANGVFTFATAVASGGAYKVTVLTQPSSPAQTCVVASGSGTASANVTNVQVTCTTNSSGGSGQWTWVNGANVVAQKGTYGTKGKAALSNVPGARELPLGWSDVSGNFWLFGGNGYDSAGALGPLNDLWQYSAGQWTWASGSNVENQTGTYGTEGTPAPGNVPGARFGSVSWTDTTGNFWLFGGQGSDSTGASGDLNDLWEYSGGQWAWMNGSNLVNQCGVSGPQGIFAPTNVPGSRVDAVSWTDASGNFWLFGGYGCDLIGSLGMLNDLWEYSAGEWAWMSGAQVSNQSGIYGTQGKSAPGNIPGARWSSGTWADASGNLWLFGGTGLDSAATLNVLNDLWEYNASSGQWTWIGGANVCCQAATYGTLGTPAAGNIPGSRAGAVSWVDKAGNFWLLGGSGYGLGATTNLNDLWKYNSGEWTWTGGSNLMDQPGTYGTEGTANSANVPGGRFGLVVWTDASGDFWLFGGSGNDSTGASGDLNDLWEYQP